MRYWINWHPEVFVRLVVNLRFFSTLYTTIPHNLIKEKMIDLIVRTFQRKWSLYLACNDRNAFFTSVEHKRYTLQSCQKVCEALIFLLDNIYIRFGTKLYRQIVGIPMGINCAPVVAWSKFIRYWGPFLDLHLIISDVFVLSKIYDKRDEFDIVNFPFLDGNISLATLIRGLYITAYSVC